MPTTDDGSYRSEWFERESGPYNTDGEADYCFDHYGECKLGSGCRCLRQGWLGQKCPDWVPLGITTMQGLLEREQSIRQGKV